MEYRISMSFRAFRFTWRSQGHSPCVLIELPQLQGDGPFGTLAYSHYIANASRKIPYLIESIPGGQRDDGVTPLHRNRHSHLKKMLLRMIERHRIADRRCRRPNCDNQ